MYNNSSYLYYDDLSHGGQPTANIQYSSQPSFDHLLASSTVSYPIATTDVGLNDSYCDVIQDNSFEHLVSVSVAVIIVLDIS